MLFSSIPFLFYFLPVVLLFYFAVPKQLKNAVLLLFSLIFYAWGEPKNVLLMLVAIILSYIFGRLIERYAGKWQSKMFLILSVGISLVLLGYFKYMGFFMDNIKAWTGLSLVVPKIVLPIGISFYTFQVISYNIDVYNQTIPAQKNLINLAAYVAMFPQLIAGPIVRYSDINKQLQDRKHTIDQVSYGIRRLIIGLSKKIFIANALGELCNIFRGTTEPSVLYYWLYAIAFTLHIYFDFSGYSDMAIGLGKVFGFDYLENFNYPYISRSITEFWRRWHMSLGSWFRDYVYIPLGGNRKGKVIWYRNILVVWMLTGLWHGASWNFVIWGLFFAAFLVVEKRWLLPYLEKSVIMSHIYVMVLVIISFVVFNADSLTQVGRDLMGMAGLTGIPFYSHEFFYELCNYAVVLFIGIIGATPLLRELYGKMQKNHNGQIILTIVEPIVLLGLLIMITAYLVDGSYNPFLYFRF